MAGPALVVDGVAATSLAEAPAQRRAQAFELGPEQGISRPVAALLGIQFVVEEPGPLVGGRPHILPPPVHGGVEAQAAGLELPEDGPLGASGQAGEVLAIGRQAHVRASGRAQHGRRDVQEACRGRAAEPGREAPGLADDQGDAGGGIEE